MFAEDATNLMLMSLNPLIEDLKLQGKRVGSFVYGSVIQHIYSHGVARDIVAETKLDQNSPGYLTRMGCISSLEGSISIANKIAMGQIECGISSGCESSSDCPVEFDK